MPSRQKDNICSDLRVLKRYTCVYLIIQKDFLQVSQGQVEFVMGEPIRSCDRADEAADVQRSLHENGGANTARSRHIFFLDAPPKKGSNNTSPQNFLVFFDQ